MILLLFYRIGNWIYYKKVPKVIRFMILVPLKILCKVLIEIPLNSEMPFRARIGGGLRIRHPYGIMINGNSIIGENCTIFHQVTIGSNDLTDGNKAATIGNNVYIGCGAKIIGKIDVGDNVIIGANAVVTKSLPNNCTASGIPATYKLKTKN